MILPDAWTAWLPAACRPCGDPAIAGLDLCPACYRALPRNRRPCLCCAAPMPRAGLRCGRCLEQPPRYAVLRAPYLYAPPLDWLIQELKFSGRLPTARLLGEVLARRLRAAAPLVDALLPMPLHPQRLRERGFNQAAELARVLARRLGLRLRHDLLRRSRATSPQVGLSPAARRANVSRAFTVSAPVRDLRLALIDDVVTTASTAQAAASALQRAGAARVEIWAVARAALAHTAAHAVGSASG